MKPRQRLRSTASQATLSNGSVVDAPQFARSKSPNTLSDRLAAQLPRMDDEIALSDTAGRSRASSIQSQATYATAEYPQSVAEPRTPSKPRPSGVAGNLNDSPSKRRSWFSSGSKAAPQQQSAEDEDMLHEEQEGAEDRHHQKASSLFGTSHQEPGAHLSSVPRAIQGQNAREQRLRKPRSWFGRSPAADQALPNDSPATPSSSASNDLRPQPSASRSAKVATEAPANPVQPPEAAQQPREADHVPQPPQQPAGWLSWLGYGSAEQQPPQASTQEVEGPEAATEEQQSVQESASPAHDQQQHQDAPSTVQPHQQQLSMWSRWVYGSSQPALAQSAPEPSTQPAPQEPADTLQVPKQREMRQGADQTQATEGSVAAAAQKPRAASSRWFDSWRAPPASEDASPPASTSAQTGAQPAPASEAQSSTSPAPVSNPVVEHVPASTWTSFFSSRYANPNKRVTHSEPESMEIDFPPELAAHNTVSSSPAPPPASAPVPAASASPAPAQPPAKTASSTFFGLGGRSSRAPSVRSEDRADGPEPPKSNLAKPLTHAPTPQPAPAPPPSNASTSSNKKPVKQLPPPMPNLVLPSFEDTFDFLPRSTPPPSRSAASSAARRVGRTIWGEDPVQRALRKSEHKSGVMHRLPRKLSVLNAPPRARVDRARKYAILTTHGWFAGPLMRTLFGEPTGTSVKFATMQKAALQSYLAQQGKSAAEDDITVIPLEGEGKVDERVNKLALVLEGRQDWLDALRQADAVFIATHSQGCIVTTQLLDRLIADGRLEGHKCSLLCLAPISQGPFAHLNSNLSSSVYFNYLENAAARELFEFQLGTSVRSERYREALTSILNNNVRVLLCASLSDQVVPLYSAMFTSFSHPNLMRSVFIDGQSFRAIDFMSNVVCLAVRIRNAGLSDHGLMIQLSEALAGALSGSGHSVLYDDPQPYLQSIRCFFETDVPPAFVNEASEPIYEPHNGRAPTNPYVLPWALRGLLEDEQISKLFAEEIAELREQFEKWQPTSKRLVDIKFRLSGFSQVPLRSSTPKL